MPVVIEQAQLLNPALTNMPTQATKALFQIVHIFQAPPDQPNLGRVISNVLLCLDAFISMQPEMSGPLSEFLDGVIKGTQTLEHDPLLDQPATLIGRTSVFQSWAFISSTLDNMPLGLFEVAGIEIAQAYLAQTKFSTGIATNLLSIAKRASDGDLSVDDLEWLSKAVFRHLEQARHVFADRAKGVDAITVSFNIRVTASLTAQTSSLRIEERQASGNTREMTSNEVRAVALELRQGVERGDSDALLICLARCLGLPFDISVHAPLACSERSASVVWIHPVQGCIYFDLDRIFPALGKHHSDQHVPTTLLLVLPLPEFIAKALHLCCSTQPGLEKLQSLSSKRRNPRSETGLKLSDAAIKASIARFIATRSGDALRAGISRDTASYATASLHLLNKSDHHYILKRRLAIWKACDQLSRHIGWGAVVADPAVDGLAYGSRLTPHREWVKQVIKLAAEAAITSKPGKRYRLASLIRHHNALACYVALVMHIVLGGRQGKIFSFCASQWAQSNAFGQHGDKQVGPTLGLTPLPIPNVLNVQIEFWLAHLSALSRRLEKLGFNEEHATLILIEQVRAGSEFPLLFTLDEFGLPQKMVKTDVFCAEATDLNIDFSRHLLPDLLGKQGVPFEHIQAWLRHFVDGISLSSSTSAAVQQVWLSRVAIALDRIALDLNLLPVHGISKAG